MPDLSSVTANYLTKQSETFVDNLSSSILALATTVPVNSTSPYADSDQVVITIEPGTANQATFTGTVSGNSFINCIWTEGNLAVGHNSGKAVVDYDSATHFAMLTKAYGTEHTSSGTHGSINPTAVTVTGQTWATMATGWLEANETWSYNTALIINVTGDVTAKYHTGTKIRLVQSSTTKYFYVQSSSVVSTHTEIVINGGSDYTFANSAVTGQVYSYADSPQGFPENFNWTPSLDAISGGSTNIAKFSMSGRKVTYHFRYTLAGAGISANPGFLLPILAGSGTAPGTPSSLGAARLYDVSATTTYFGTMIPGTLTGHVQLAFVEATGNTVVSVSSTVPFTWATGDIIDVRGEYWISEFV